ncbi:MAG: ABC transporter permease [Bacteroidota bacterium]
MIVNYLTIAFRNLAKYKVFSFINIVGMAISLASCLLISIFVVDELSYDKHLEDADRKFRVYNIASQEGATRYLPIVPYAFALHMKADFPEIEEATRVMDTYQAQMFQLGDVKTMEPNGIFSESSVFDMLSIKLVYQTDSILGRPLTVVLSESLAKKYFGDSNPVGKSIKIDDTDREITGVFLDVPEQTHIRINFILPFAGTSWAKYMDNNFRRQQIFTYLKLKPGTDWKELESKFIGFNERHTVPQLAELNLSYDTRLQNVKDVHLNSSNFEWEIAQRGDAQSIYILVATAIMILGIACLNFVNLLRQGQ